MFYSKLGAILKRNPTLPALAGGLPHLSERFSSRIKRPRGPVESRCPALLLFSPEGLPDRVTSSTSGNE